MNHITRGNRLNVAPIVIASDEPSEPDLWVVEQKLFPVVAHALKLNAADHKADDHLLYAFELTHRTDWNNRRRLWRLQSLHEGEPTLAYVQERAAVRAGHSKALIGCTQFKWTPALSAIELSSRD